MASQANTLYNSESQAFAESLIPAISALGCTVNVETNIECCGPGPRNADGSCGGTIQQQYAGIPGMLPIDWRTGILSDPIMQASCCGCGGNSSNNPAGTGAGSPAGGGSNGAPAGTVPGPSGFSAFFGGRFPWWLLVLVLILIFHKEKD
jgi:hypothetical protein